MVRIKKPKPTDLEEILSDTDLESIKAMSRLDGNRLDGYPEAYAYSISMWNVQLCCSMNPTVKRIFRVDDSV